MEIIAITYSFDTSMEASFRQGVEKQDRKEIFYHSKLGKVYLFTNDRKRYYSKYPQIIHIPCGVSLGICGILCYYFFAALAMIRLSKDFKVIKAHGTGCLHAALVSKISRKPLVVLYGYQWYQFTQKRYASSTLSFVGRIIESFVLRQSSTTIALTSTLAKIAINGGAKRVIVKIKGVDLEDTRNIEKMKKNLKHAPHAKSNTTILFVGRLTKIKGVEYLIEALSYFFTLNPDEEVSLIVIGDGPQKEKLLELAKKYGLNQKIRFVGFVAHKTVLEYMRMADLLILPSLREGTPRVVMEAMSVGLPVIGSNVIGIKDLVANEETGLLVNARDPKAICNAIVTLLRDKSMLDRMSKNAIKKAIKDFDIKDYFDTIQRELTRHIR